MINCRISVEMYFYHKQKEVRINFYRRNCFNTTSAHKFEGCNWIIEGKHHYATMHYFTKSLRPSTSYVVPQEHMGATTLSTELVTN